LRRGLPVLSNDEKERPASPNGRAYAVSDGNPCLAFDLPMNVELTTTWYIMWRS
jgi:hypothetical protein